MAYLWLGILSGLLLSYLIVRIGRSRTIRERGHRVRWKKAESLSRPERVRFDKPSVVGGRRSANKRLHKRLRVRNFVREIYPAQLTGPGQGPLQRWPAWAGWAVVGLFAACLLLAIRHGIDQAQISSEWETGGFYRLAQNLVAPFVSGLLIGIVLVQLMVNVEWPFLSTLSGLGIALVIALLLTKDPSLSFLDQLRSASVAGLSLEFGGRPSAEEGSFSRVAVDFGSNKTEYALQQLAHFPSLMDRDQTYMDEAGFIKGRHARLIAKQRSFAERVIAPTAKMLSDLRDLPRERDVWSLTNRRVASDLREAIVGRPSGLRYSGRRQIALIGQLFKTLDELWVRMCEEVPPADQCHLQRKLVAYAGRKTTREMTFDIARLPVRIFDSNHPYGIVLSSLVLLMAGEEDAAVADLEAWLVTALKAANAEGPDSHRWVGLYRAYYLQAYILARRAYNSVYLSATIETLEQAVRIGRMVVEESKWAPRFKQVTCGLPAASQGTAYVEFLRFRWAYLNALNNYAYMGSLNRDAMLHDSSHAAKVHKAADAAIGTPWHCHGQPAESALSFAVASYDTRAAAYLVTAGNSQGESTYNRQKAACAALESVKASEPLVKELKKVHVPGAPHEELIWRGQINTLDALFRKYARDARRSADQLNAYEQCVGLKLRS